MGRKGVVGIRQVGKREGHGGCPQLSETVANGNPYRRFHSRYIQQCEPDQAALGKALSIASRSCGGRTFISIWKAPAINPISTAAFQAAS